MIRHLDEGSITPKRLVALRDETESGGVPFVRPWTIMWNYPSIQGNLKSYVQPHLPYTTGICAYYEQATWLTRNFTYNPQTGIVNAVGVVVDSSGGGMSGLINCPDLCMTSVDASTTKIKGNVYDTWDSKVHRLSLPNTSIGSSVNVGGTVVDKLKFGYSYCVVIACVNLEPARFIPVYGLRSDSNPTSCAYENGLLYDYKRWVCQKTYQGYTYDIYVMSSLVEETNNGKYYLFYSDPCIGLNVTDKTKTFCSCKLLYACTELNASSS